MHFENPLVWQYILLQKILLCSLIVTFRSQTLRKVKKCSIECNVRKNVNISIVLCIENSDIHGSPTKVTLIHVQMILFDVVNVSE